MVVPSCTAAGVPWVRSRLCECAFYLTVAPANVLPSHALNDADIPYHQTELICKTVLGLQQVKTDMVHGDDLESDNLLVGSQGPAVLNYNKKGFPSLRFELVAYGGEKLYAMCLCCLLAN